MAMKPPTRPGSVAKALAAGPRAKVSPGLIASMGPKRPAQTSPPISIKALVGALSQPPNLPPGVGPTANAPGMTPTAIPPAQATGPYQGAAGSEAQHPGQERVPTADWANQGSANYERRNYYVHDGQVIAREPGYYNPDNPWDTGRPGETNKEFGAWDPSAERRMSEPGVTPWGPGGKASAPGAFPAPSGSAPGSPQRAPSALMAALLGAGPTANVTGDMQAPNEQLMALIRALIGRVPGGGRSSIPA